MLIAVSPVLAQVPKTGPLSMRLVSTDYRNLVTPGADNYLQMVVTNTGNQTVTNIVLRSFQPGDWTIEINPRVITNLGVNSLQSVDLNVRPPADARRGFYNITITAEATETTGILDFSVNVDKTTSIWLWIGVAIVAVVVAGFVFVFLRYGRNGSRQQV